MSKRAIDKGKEKAPVIEGRPTLYKDEYPELARKYCLLGATDKDLADFFEVNPDTIYEWKNVHPDFSEAIKKGKSQADANVADRLYQRAMGYEHDEVDIKAVAGVIVQTPIKKIYPPDPTAAIFWLKNRQRSRWRDKQEVEHSGVISNQSSEQIQARIAELEAKRAKKIKEKE